MIVLTRPAAKKSGNGKKLLKPRRKEPKRGDVPDLNFFGLFPLV